MKVHFFSPTTLQKNIEYPWVVSNGKIARYCIINNWDFTRVIKVSSVSETRKKSTVFERVKQ